MQLYGYFYVHVSGQRQTGLAKKQFYEPLNYGARDARAVCVFHSF